MARSIIICIFELFLSGRKCRKKNNPNSNRSESDKSSSISTQDLELLVDKLKGEQHRDSTRKNYYGVWKLFNKFFLRLDVKPLNWEERMVLFIGYLIEQGKQSSTIRSYLSAVRSVLKVEGVKFNEDVYLLNALTRACKLKNDQIKTRLPISKNLMKKLLKALNSIFANQPYLLCLYSAIFTTTYAGLFRIGEVTESPHVVKAADVSIGTNKKKMKFTLRSSKTHTRGDRPQIIKIKSEAAVDKLVKGNFCPFKNLLSYIQMREGFMSNKQFFIFGDGSPVKPHHFREVLNECLIKAGYDPSLYSVHGMRSGKALELLHAGVSIETIKKLGRWRSNAVFAYLKLW